MFPSARFARLPLNLWGTHHVLSVSLSFLKTFTRLAIFNLFSSLRKVPSTHIIQMLWSLEMLGPRIPFPFAWEETGALSRVYDTLGAISSLYHFYWDWSYSAKQALPASRAGSLYGHSSARCRILTLGQQWVLGLFLITKREILTCLNQLEYGWHQLLIKLKCECPCCVCTVRQFNLVGYCSKWWKCSWMWNHEEKRKQLY